MGGKLKLLWWFFYDGLVLGLFRHLVLVLALLFLLGVVSFDLIASYGIPLLFWHEIWWKQLLAGLFVALSVVTILFNAYLLDTGRDDRYWHKKIPKANQPGQSDGSSKSTPVATLVEARIYLRMGILYWLTLAVTVGIIHFVFHVGGASVVDLPWPGRLPLPIGFAMGLVIAWKAFKSIFKLMEKGEENDLTAQRSFLWRSTDKIRQQIAKPIRDDPDNRTNLRLRALSGMVGIGLALIYIGIAFFVRFSHEAVIIPAAGLCMMTMLLCAGYAFAAIRSPFRGSEGWHSLWSNAGVLAIVLVLAMCVGGYPDRKIRFEGLDTYYSNPPSVYAMEKDKIKSLGLIEPDEWLKSASSDGNLHPLVIVCSSGGGIRAAAWAGAVLGHLDESLPGFPYRVKLMTGASGGMLGNAYYASTIVPPSQSGVWRHSLNEVGEPYLELTTRDLVGRLAEDSLSATVKQMLFSDLPLVVWPSERSMGKDRGAAMERSWRDHMGEAFENATFGMMRPGERDHWRPSLIFSPMMVEDGRRMLISNLDLNFMCFSGGHRLGTPADDGPVTHLKGHDHYIYSQSGYEFSNWFPQSFDGFRLSTAARMSASFPYVSPAGELPTEYRRRVVDAGYYDNYGLTTATSWLIHCIDGYQTPRLEQFCSGVVIIQIRDSVNQLDGNHSSLNGVDDDPSSMLSRGWEWITSPLSGYMAAGDSVSLFRNDTALEKLSQLFDDQGYEGNFFTTVQFDYSGGTLTWYLTKGQTKDILNAADAMDGGPVSSGDQQRDKNNALAMNALNDWWKAHDGKAAH